MTRKFINREIELKRIKNLLSSDKFEFIVIYGRRRVRKTAAKIIKELAEKIGYVFEKSL